jgi:hypothetical protein
MAAAWAIRILATASNIGGADICKPPDVTPIKSSATSSTRTSRTTRVWSLSRRSRSVAPYAEWAESKVNKPADADDLRTVTKLVNGGLIGLSERKQWLAKAKGLFDA